MSETLARRTQSAKGVAARRLVRRARQAALCTVSAEPGTDPGAPFGSLVTIATDPAGAPIMLLSRLAEHTRNLMADPRAALLIADPADAHLNPQEDARVTVMGTLAPDTDPVLRARFLARHPYAEMYADFSDFRIFRMSVKRAHMVGGFGRAGWIDEADAMLVPDRIAGPLAAGEANLCRRLEERHAADFQHLAGPGAWRVAALDADGLDVVPAASDHQDLHRGPAMRLPFSAPLTTIADLEAAILAMVAEAS